MVSKFIVCLLMIRALTAAVSAAPSLSPIHYTISRRSGSFPAPDTADLTYLLQELRLVEIRFNATTREVNGNKVVRRPKRTRGTQSSTVLLGEVGRTGNWFANITMGEPSQTVDMDLDMLTADFWLLSTSSSKGSWFLDFNSKTYVDSEEPLSFPTCRGPTDILRLPTIQRPIPFTFAHCRPAKQWLRTLLPSGAYLGLAPSASLTQTKTVGLLQQLVEKKVIDLPIWSLLLINGKEGIFSIGGTSAASVRQAEKETDEMLNPGEHDETKRDASKSKADDERKGWKWMKVHGAEGWWQILMRGIWVNGMKVLDSQPIVLDVNTPFIVAPPLVAQSFYSSISGSRRLPPPYDQFHAYPCFNPPKIHFEFEQWNVQVLKGHRDKGTFSPGGRFSLGRMATGSGYCIGIVVESRMGVRTALARDEFETSGSTDGGNGLADVWIIGEPFFRDVQVAFDWTDKNVGMQRA